MTFREWINNLMSVGLLCGDYTDRVNSAFSKKQIADIGLDANGISYVCRMAQKGYPLPYETLLKEFKSFINGKYVYESKPNDRGYTYKTEMYVCYDGFIDVRTTALALLGSKARLNLREFAVTDVHVDENCDIEIECPLSSRCRVYLYGDAKVNILNNSEKVKLIVVDKDAED